LWILPCHLAGQIILVTLPNLTIMKNILVFGAGKSSNALIEYFLSNANVENWRLTVVDASLETIQEKLGNSPYGIAISFDITREDLRKQVIAEADIVISLMPPSLHILIAKDCLAAKKNLLTASYLDPQIKELKKEIEENGLLFLCEMGLDPGIDHMSAKKLIDNIQADGGKVTSFYSHCGGLVAPESDDNPWHYKISWNPRNVVMAGKAGAMFRQNSEIRELSYEELFSEKRYISVPDSEPLCWYPNRDSLSYISTYGLEDTPTFIRTTLRHPDFIYGWKNLIDLKLTAEEKIYRTDGKTLLQFFKEHMDLNGFGEWLQHRLTEQFDSTKTLLSELANLVKLEEEAAQKGIDPVEEFMMVDDKGDLQNIDIDSLKVSAATTLADRMHDANLTLKQLFYLGMDDGETYINKGQCSAADVLQYTLEKKLMLQPNDKDMVVMLHEISYTKEGVKYKVNSSLTLKGEDGKHTAMSQTVGLPLAIATKLILENKLPVKGLHIPVIKEIYEPVLSQLAGYGITFTETVVSE
jgi:saccharopine dehydrogenase-like NADP-dependent oxidoreductase